MNYCYILYNDVNNATYNGYTIDLARRLRQHNSQIKGGARMTTRAVGKGIAWKYLCVVVCNDVRFDKHMALSLEWWIKKPHGLVRGRRPAQYCGAAGRLLGLAKALQLEKFAGLPFVVHILDGGAGTEHLEILSNLTIVKHTNGTIAIDRVVQGNSDALQPS